MGAIGERAKGEDSREGRIATMKIARKGNNKEGGMRRDGEGRKSTNGVKGRP